MHALLSALVTLTMGSPSPQVAVDDTTQCVDAAALNVALADVLPEPWREVADGMSLTVGVTGDAAGEASTLSFELVITGAASAGLTRDMPIISADCASLPKLVAVIIGRHLADLPSEVWPTPAAPPPPASPAPGEASEPTQVPEDEPGALLGLTLRSGFEAGLDTSLWGGAFGVDGAASWSGGFGLCLGAEVTVFAPVSIEDGDAQLTTVTGRFGPTWRVPLGASTLGFGVGVGAGVTVARGTGFGRNVTAVAAVAHGWADVTLRLPWAMTASVVTGVAIVRPRLGVQGAGQQVDLPLGRIGLSIGYVFGD